jgi:cytochrome c biogenesis protein ResB
VPNKVIIEAKVAWFILCNALKLGTQYCSCYFVIIIIIIIIIISSSSSSSIRVPNNLFCYGSTCVDSAYFILFRIYIIVIVTVGCILSSPPSRSGSKRWSAVETSFQRTFRESSQSETGLLTIIYTNINIL